MIKKQANPAENEHPQGESQGKSAPKKPDSGKRISFLREFLPYGIGTVSAMLFANLLIGLFCGCGPDTVASSYLTGPGGLAINRFLFGTFGVSALTLPLIGVNFTVFGRQYLKKRLIPQKILLALLVQVVLGALFHILFLTFGAMETNLPVAGLYEWGISMRGGGVIGGTVGQLLWNSLNMAGSLMLLVCTSVIACRFFIGLVPFGFIKKTEKKREAVKAPSATPTLQKPETVAPETETVTRVGGEKKFDPYTRLPTYKKPVAPERYGSLDTSRTAESERANGYYVGPPPFAAHAEINRAPAVNAPVTPVTPEQNCVSPTAPAPVSQPDPDGRDREEQETVMPQTAGTVCPERRAALSEAGVAAPAAPVGTSAEDGDNINDVVHAAGNAACRIRSAMSGTTVSPRSGDLFPEKDEIPVHSVTEPATAEPELPPEEYPEEIAEPEEIPAEEPMPEAEEDKPFSKEEPAEEIPIPEESAPAEIPVAPTKEAQPAAPAPQTPPDAPFRAVETNVGDLPPEPKKPPHDYSQYKKPPIDLLRVGDPPSAESMEEMENNRAIIANTLESFRIHVDKISYQSGPAITRYEVKPSAGVLVSSVTRLEDNLAMDLSCQSLRIEAPIPGHPAIGLEVPKKHRDAVSLRSLVDTAAFQQSNKLLNTCLGLDVVGTPVYCDLAAMPHLLIAGATGAGKSVCINSIIMSLLYHTTPEDVRLILIDPKQVEFRIYRDIPHLFVPVVSGPKDAAAALSCAAKEMDDRFNQIQQMDVRDIVAYNRIAANDPELPHMPQMVIIIDELADLMMLARDIVEKAIVRLAQLGRAAGVHLVIGTQRPSVDVITGLLKANITSRIAFTVTSSVDARTIMDTGGAEKLTGKGDMLYAPIGANKRLRVQGAFVTDDEVANVVDYLKRKNGHADYNEKFMEQMHKESLSEEKVFRDGSDDDGEDGETALDPLFVQAANLAITTGKLSTSLMQRRLSIGYGRAAKIIDSMEAYGVISGADGNKPREVHMTIDEFNQKLEDGTIPAQ